MNKSKEYSVGLISDASPEGFKAAGGVSVEYAPDEKMQWYVLRATYGRQQQAYDYMSAEGVECYMPMHTVYKEIDGRKKKRREPLVPGLLFVHTTSKAIVAYAKDNPRLPFLNFYYDHFRSDSYGKNPPLVVGDKEMHNFMRLTGIDNEHVRLVEREHVHYKGGEDVLVTDGEFEGIMGKVARVAGQQRVVVELKGVCIVATAYIPTAFLEVCSP